MKKPIQCSGGGELKSVAWGGGAISRSVWWKTCLSKRLSSVRTKGHIPRGFSEGMLLVHLMDVIGLRLSEQIRDLRSISIAGSKSCLIVPSAVLLNMSRLSMRGECFGNSINLSGHRVVD